MEISFDLLPEKIKILYLRRQSVSGRVNLRIFSWTLEEHFSCNQKLCDQYLSTHSRNFESFIIREPSCLTFYKVYLPKIVKIFMGTNLLLLRLKTTASAVNIMKLALTILKQKKKIVQVDNIVFVQGYFTQNFMKIGLHF